MQFFTLRISGSDLIIFGSLVDSSHNALAGETITAKVQRGSDNYYWNDGTNTWQLADPGAFSVSEVGSTGRYNNTMTGAYSAGENEYLLTIVETGTFNRSPSPYWIALYLAAESETNIGTPVDLGDGATLADMLTALAGKTASAASYDRTADSQEAIRDRGDAAWSSAAAHPDVLENTTIATLASQTSFTLTAGSSDDSAYDGAMVVVTDSATAEQKAVADILTYTGATKTVTLEDDPGIFTMAVGDSIAIIAKKVSVDANLVSVNNETTNDSVDWDEFFKKAQAILYGKVVRSSNNYKYRDQADANDEVDYDISGSGRTIN